MDKDGNVTGYKINSESTRGDLIADGKQKGSSYSVDEPISLYTTTPGSGTDTFTLDLSGIRFIRGSSEAPLEVEIEEKIEEGIEGAAGGAGSPISFSISDEGRLF